MKNNKVYKYIKEHYDYGEPILSTELKHHLNMSDNAIRQIIKKLYDSGDLKRIKPGIYFRPKPNSLKIILSQLLNVRIIIKKAICFIQYFLLR